MATAAADPAGADSLRKGDVVKEQMAQEPAPGSVVQETEPVRPLNGASFSTSRSSGPPILHPTDTTWQWLFASTDMVHTPTVVHSGLTVEQERYSRWKGVQLIFRIGDYMRLGNHVMSTASVFFHRFYMRRALPRDVRERAHDTFTFQEMAPTCIFLACKVEETHRKLHGVVEATMAVLDRSPTGIELAETRSYKPDVQSKEYRRWKDLVLLYEERLLETLCFDLVVEQPHPIAIKACKRLGTSRDMAQLTVILLNTILYGAVCVCYDAATLAAAAFQKACNLVDIDPASFLQGSNVSRTWYDAFGVDPEEVADAMPDVEEHVGFHNERLIGQQAASKGHVSTPNVHQHTSLLAQRGGELETPTSASKQLHFASQETVIDGTNEEGPAVGASELTAPPSETEREGESEGEGDSSVLQREERTDPSRPISRHGSKGANRRPPPPFTSSAEPVEEPKESSEGDHHEEAVAAKVQQEQIQQEETAMTSEEEGAL